MEKKETKSENKKPGFTIWISDYKKKNTQRNSSSGIRFY